MDITLKKNQSFCLSIDLIERLKQLAGNGALEDVPELSMSSIEVMEKSMGFINMVSGRNLKNMLILSSLPQTRTTLPHSK